MLVHQGRNAATLAYSDSDGIHVVDVSTGEAALVIGAGVVDWFGDDTLVVVP